MPERPIILFPQPEVANRTTNQVPPKKIFKPNIGRQLSRLQPSFSVLQEAYNQKRIMIQQSPSGINPEFALVFEVVGTVDSFFTAVKHVNGFEWMFDLSIENIEADDDFYYIDDHGQREEKDLTGKLYCVMSNQEAMSQLLSLWDRYCRGEQDVFQRGFAGLRDIFINIKNIRQWNSQDRIAETHIVDYWKESLEIDGDIPVPFEIELFFRNDAEKRRIAINTISTAIHELNGSVKKECYIEDIHYHCLLVELPRVSIQSLIDNYDHIKLAKVDDVMFFRPTCQSAFYNYEDTQEYDNQVAVLNEISGEPIIAVLDGMPMQNHMLLVNKLIVDDPDDFQQNYESKHRMHGTSMASLVLYGDLERNDVCLSQPIYIRPILKPHISFSGDSVEIIPQNEIFVDLVHRAVKRIFEGDGEESAAAPTVKVINFSIGDPVRQFANDISPLAKLLDWLSYKYKVLFIVSAGNLNHGGLNINKNFSELKSASIDQREKSIYGEFKNNIRNLKVLSPAETINNITVGALYADASSAEESERVAFAVRSGMPSPISSFGLGYNKNITPDLYYYGGRKFLFGNFRNEIIWQNNSRAPGCKVAAPYSEGSESGMAYTFGTSDAAAQLSHEAGKCYKILNEIFVNETQADLPAEFASILLKAMLTHGASWDTVSQPLSEALDISCNQLCRWIGNGIPDISRVEECTQNRATLIGMGKLKKDDAHIFRLELPFDFSSQLIKRKLTVTLAYFSPLDFKRQKYRSAQLWFDIEKGSELVPRRQNTEWRTVRRGTLQHEIFTGESALVWNNDEIVIKVNCKEDASKFSGEIPYGLFVTFEIAEGLDVDVYSTIKEIIKPPVQVQSRQLV